MTGEVSFISRAGVGGTGGSTCVRTDAYEAKVNQNCRYFNTGDRTDPHGIRHDSQISAQTPAGKLQAQSSLAQRSTDRNGKPISIRLDKVGNTADDN